MSTIPKYDVTKMQDSFNQKRLDRQASGRRPGVLYFSDWYGMSHLLLNSPALRAELFRKAWATKKALKKAVGERHDGERDQRLRDTLRVRKVIPGGAQMDRATFEIYSINPERFWPAIIQKEKRAKAISKALREVAAVG